MCPLPVVVGDGLDADKQVAGKTDCLNDARILEAWYDEYDLRNKLWEQVVGSSCACPFDDHPVCKKTAGFRRWSWGFSY